MSSELPKSESKDKVIFLTEEEASVPSKVMISDFYNKPAGTELCQGHGYLLIIWFEFVI